MYLECYRLEAKPFEIEPDPRFVWLGEKHREAFEAIQKGILENEGIVFLTGEPGTGKSTFLGSAIRFWEHAFHCVQITDPSRNGIDLFRRLMDAFGIENAATGQEDLFGCLRRFAYDASEGGRKAVLLIDDAHRISSKLLRQIRLLENIRREGQALIPAVFAGQNEGVRLLSANRAFSQSVAMNYILQPLTEKETAEYIVHRLRVAGSETEIFTSNAMAEIFHLSGGIPRLINIICDNALLSGHARNARTIGPEIILDSQGPGHRLIHEICELDKELSAQRPPQLPMQRAGALAIGVPQSNKKPLPASSPGYWQVLLERLGLKPLTVKAALVAPVSLILLLGIFVHFYFPAEDEEPPFTHVQIYAEQVPAHPTILQAETAFNVPSGSQGVAPAAEAPTIEGRIGRQPGMGVPWSADRAPAHEINRLREQQRFLVQELQTLFEATAQMAQRLQVLERESHAEKDSPSKLRTEVFSEESQIQELRQALETYARQQFTLQEAVQKACSDHAQLQAQLMDLRTQKARAPVSADAPRAPLKPKRSGVRPEKR